QGTQGKGVVIAETNQAAESVISAFQGLNADILIQEFIKEAEGRDIRCFVVGDKVVGSMERQAKQGEFRSNIHRGGHASPIKITKEERQMAVKAAKILGLKVAGVDLIRSNDGPMLLEVNSSPGLQGIETATGKDIATNIIEYIEKHYKELPK
ncbi:MAG: RimK family alpha-L-glutamate ligase, partial [Alphaproteobacteria bacterium]